MCCYTYSPANRKRHPLWCTCSSAVPHVFRIGTYHYIICAEVIYLTPERHDIISRIVQVHTIHWTGTRTHKSYAPPPCTQYLPCYVVVTHFGSQTWASVSKTGRPKSRPFTINAKLLKEDCIVACRTLDDPSLSNQHEYLVVQPIKAYLD